MLFLGRALFYFVRQKIPVISGTLISRKEVRMLLSRHACLKAYRPISSSVKAAGNVYACQNAQNAFCQCVQGINEVRLKFVKMPTPEDFMSQFPVFRRKHLQTLPGHEPFYRPHLWALEINCVIIQAVVMPLKLKMIRDQVLIN
uniref:Uncharacterized protein n=1 Tax=Glossina austeni TaxID=7395 RepID=A0A1A9UMZ1_GLOAU